MEAREAEEGGPSLSKNLPPRQDVEPEIDLAENSRRILNERRLTPTDRIEARADRHILDLQNDRRRLQEEIQRLRHQEISHLREDLRWLEDHASGRSQAMARLKTAFEYATAFSWFSSALVTLGGGAVGLAAFLSLSLGPQRLIAAVGFAGLSVGVVVQGVNSYRGMEVLREPGLSSAFAGRPNPNPVVSDSDHGSDGP